MMLRKAFLFIIWLGLLSAGVMAKADRLSFKGAPAVSGGFELFSPVFADGGDIPERYTCRAEDISPPLDIRFVPPETKSLALTVHDPDGLAGPWVHWVVFNIPPGTREIRENVSPGTEALNDFGNFSFAGPCPIDARKHEYIFTIYALSEYLADVNEGETKQTLEKAMARKILAKAVLIGKYQNPQGGEQ